jgi:hypothetical protein
MIKYNAIVSNDALANATSLYMELITPASGLFRIANIIGAMSEVPGILTLVEAPTITDGTTVISAIHRNRHFTQAPTLVRYSDPTAISGGTQVARQLIGGAGAQGVTINMEPDYIILKNSTKYLITLLNSSGGAAYAQITLSWVEGPSK